MPSSARPTASDRGQQHRPVAELVHACREPTGGGSALSGARGRAAAIEQHAEHAGEHQRAAEQADLDQDARPAPRRRRSASSRACTSTPATNTAAAAQDRHHPREAERRLAGQEHRRRHLHAEDGGDEAAQRRPARPSHRPIGPAPAAGRPPCAPLYRGPPRRCRRRRAKPPSPPAVTHPNGWGQGVAAGRRDSRPRTRARSSPGARRERAPGRRRARAMLGAGGHAVGVRLALELVTCAGE